MDSIYIQYLVLQKYANISLEFQDCLGSYNELTVGLHLNSKLQHLCFMDFQSNPQVLLKWST